MAAKGRSKGSDSEARKAVPPSVRRALSSSSTNFAAWRKLRGLTQSQLADRADVGVRTVRRLEDGDGGVTFENVVRVLRALGIVEVFTEALDPYRTDIGRLRSDERLPDRVRPRRLD